MRAAQMKDYGSPEVIAIAEVDKPTLAPNQVLVAVHAASINPFDAKLRSGMMKDSMPLTLPMTLGGDIAGVVVAVGQDVTAITEGQRVYGQALVVAGNSGAFADFAATNVGQIARMPSNCDFIQAAALPLVGVSALQALTEHLALQSGQKILIHGAAGGIGSVAVQIAKHIGAYVAATVRDEEAAAFVRSLGADQIINTQTTDTTQELRDFDALYDLVGEDFTQQLAILKPGARAVSMTAQGYEAAAEAAQVTALTQFTQVTTERLAALGELVEQEVVSPKVDKIFALQDVSEAFSYQESGAAKGKVVITMSDEG